VVAALADYFLAGYLAISMMSWRSERSATGMRDAQASLTPMILCRPSVRGDRQLEPEEPRRAAAADSRGSK